MADAVRVVCKTCKTSHWIGQIPSFNPNMMVIYSSRAELDWTAAYLMHHLGHELTIVGEQAFGKLIDSGVVKKDFD